MENYLGTPLLDGQVKKICVIDLLTVIQAMPKGSKKTFGDFTTLF